MINTDDEHKHIYNKQQLETTITLYENFRQEVNRNIITYQLMQQKGEMFLQWLNNTISSRIHTLNQVIDKSIQIFHHQIKQQIETHSRIIQLEHEIHDKSTIIENNIYNFKRLQQKLFQRELDIEKLKVQVHELNERIESQEITFKKQTKQYKKTFRIIQEDSQSSKYIMDSIQSDYDQQKQQNRLLSIEIQKLKQQKSHINDQNDQLKRLLQAAENKLEREVKLKIPLEDKIKSLLNIIETLYHEIALLKQTKQNQHADDDDENYINRDSFLETEVYPMNLNEIKITDQIEDARQSFISQTNFDDIARRKDSMRKSFYDEYEPQSEFQNVNQNKLQTQVINNVTNDIINQQVKVQDQTKFNQVPTDTQNVQKEQKKEQKNKQQIVIEKQQNRSRSNSSFRGQLTTDIYYAHFLLTSQGIKIKQDREDFLNIDMKSYYKEIKQKHIPMHLWHDWIRDKLYEKVSKK